MPDVTRPARRRHRRRPRRPRRRRAPARRAASSRSIFEAGDGVGASVRDWGARAPLLAVGVQHRPRRRRPARGRGLGRAAGRGLPDRRRDRRALPRAARRAAARSAAALRATARASTAVTRARDRQAQGRRPRRGAVRARSSTDGGVEQRYLARAVIDASGTWTQPNPLGAGGVPAAGERAAADRIAYRIPDVLGARPRALRRQARPGGRHRPLGLQRARRPRRAARARAGHADRVGDPARGARATSSAAAATTSCPRAARSARPCAGCVDDGADRARHRLPDPRDRRARRAASCSRDGERELVADEVIATTGFRPDLSLLAELRLDLDDRVEAPRALAPLIDPNVHSCGTVPPHGVDELSHPDAGFYVVGMKSYGRAPTFLLRTGYEQVRSVVAALAGDWEAARKVDLVLPETGVCSAPRAPRAAAGARAAAPARARRVAADAREAPSQRRRATPRQPAGARGPGRSSARSRSPRPSPGGSSTTPSRSSCSRCSASSASPPPSSPAPSRSPC